MTPSWEAVRIPVYLLGAGAILLLSWPLLPEAHNQCIGISCPGVQESLAAQPGLLVYLVGGLVSCLAVIGVCLLTYDRAWGRGDSP